MFSCLSRHLHQHQLTRVDDIEKAWRECYKTKQVHCEEVDSVPDFKQFIMPHLADLHGYTKTDAVQLLQFYQRESDDEVRVRVKRRSTDQDWRDSCRLFKPPGCPAGSPLLRVARQPLRLKELQRSINILLRYLKGDRPALEAHWSQYMTSLEELQQSACAECTRLAGVMQASGTRKSDSKEQKTAKRRQYSQAAKQLAAHKLQDPAAHGCREWLLPPPLVAHAPSPVAQPQESSGPLIWVGNSRPASSRIADPEFKVGKFVVVRGTAAEKFWVGRLTAVKRGTGRTRNGFQVHWYVSATSSGQWRPPGPYKPNYMEKRGKTVKHTDWLPWDTTVAVTDMVLPNSGMLPTVCKELITACDGVDYQFS